MVRAAIVFGLILAGAPLLAQQLPSAEPDSSEIEPPILPGTLEPEKTAGDVGALERKLARARDSAAGAERLWKMGVLSKVEAENRALQVVRFENELAKARLSAAETSEDQELARAATEAEAKLKRAELAAAEVNLARQQKLLALGSGAKYLVRRAQQKLAELKANVP